MAAIPMPVIAPRTPRRELRNRHKRVRRLAFDRASPTRVRAKQKGRDMLQSFFPFVYGALRYVLGAFAVGYLLAFPTLTILAKVTARRQDYTDHKWEKLLWRVTRRVRRRGPAERAR